VVGGARLQARRYRTVKIKAGKQMLTRRSAPRVRT